MEKMTGIVERISKRMDQLAGACVVGVMLLVVGNILLRKLFKLPIQGTYELVGYLTALAISLALANCAWQNAHIGVDYIREKFPNGVQKVTTVLNSLIAMVFWGIATWQMGSYSLSMMRSGTVSPTAQIPVYPVVFLIALGFLALSLVMAVKLSKSLQIVFADAKLGDFVTQPVAIANAKEGN